MKNILISLIVIIICINHIDCFKISRSSQRHSEDDITTSSSTSLPFIHRVGGGPSSSIYKSDVSSSMKQRIFDKKSCESGKFVNNQCVETKSGIDKSQDKIKEFSKLTPIAPIKFDEESEEPISEEGDSEEGDSEEVPQKPIEKVKVPTKVEKHGKEKPISDEESKEIEESEEIKSKPKEKVIKDDKKDTTSPKKLSEKVPEKPQTKKKEEVESPPKSKPMETKVGTKSEKDEKPVKVKEEKAEPKEEKVKEKKVETKTKEGTISDKAKEKVEKATPKEDAKKPSKPKPEEKVTKPEIKKQEKVKPPVADKKPSKPKVDEKPKKSDDAKAKSEKKATNKSDQKDKKSKKSKKPTYTPITQRHFDRLYYSFPSFAPNYTRISNTDCKIQGQVLIRQLKAAKLWSMKMLDSTGKVPSGILHGNLNQFGDYDQCTGISTKIKLGNNQKNLLNIQGKYCLIHLDIESTSSDMDIPLNMAQGRTLIKSTYNDPGHFIPRFSTINWGLCIPDSCSAKDAKQIMSESLRPYNHSEITGLRFHVYSSEENCFIKEKTKTIFDYSIPTLVTIVALLTIGFIVIVATLRDTIVNKENPSLSEQILHSFSMRRTTTVLLEDKHAPGEITCIHGIRSICTLMLYVAHKLIPLGSLPFSNRTDLTELANAEWSTLFRGSLMYTDSFLLISGVLSAYNMSQDMEKKDTVKWKDRLLARYMRLTPALAAVILFYAYIFELIGEGPLWNEIVIKNANICKENFWKNLLYIQNFFPFEEICSTHTHQLALDMQLSLLSPILVWFWYKKPMFALLLVINLHILSFGVRFYFTTHHRLSLYVFHGISITQLYRSANKSYGQTLNRATSYIAGVCLGILLKDVSKRKFELPKVLSIAGWLTTTYFAGWILVTPAHMAKRNYVYNVPEAAQYAALTPVALSLALSWVIFYCFVESSSLVNQILSHRYMVLFSRISYPIYLVQFIVFFYNVGVTRNSSEFDLFSGINVAELLIVIGIATVLTLTLDLPMQDLKKVLFSASNNDKNNVASSSPDLEVHAPVEDDDVDSNHHIDEPISEEHDDLFEDESDDAEFYNLVRRKN